MCPIKSRDRVANHGEVFTDSNLVNAMLDLVDDESRRIDSRVLEPACGSGNFLVEILYRKLDQVQKKHGRSEFENRHYSLLAVMSIYGIELLPDNIAECRLNVLEVLCAHLKIDQTDPLVKAASYVLSQNLVHGDAMTMKNHEGKVIEFAEWAYLGKGKYKRRDFSLISMTTKSDVVTQNFSLLYSDSQAYEPVREWDPMTINDLSQIEG